MTRNKPASEPSDEDPGTFGVEAACEAERTRVFAFGSDAGLLRPIMPYKSVGTGSTATGLPCSADRYIASISALSSTP